MFQTQVVLWCVLKTTSLSLSLFPVTLLYLLPFLPFDGERRKAESIVPTMDPRLLAALAIFFSSC